jgi:hypothetical protein
MSGRVFKPMILQTKQQLLTALKKGHIPTSKYNLLSREEKLFVEMVVFGGYTAEQAVKVIFPKVRSARAKARQLIAKKDIADTLEELSINQDKKFLAEASNYRDMALSKLKYIMQTTGDEAVAVVAAKAILEQTNKVYQEQFKKDRDKDRVTGININIIAANPPEPEYDPNDVVVVEAQTEEPEPDPETNLPYALDFTGESLQDEEE